MAEEGSSSLRQAIDGYNRLNPAFPYLLAMTILVLFPLLALFAVLMPSEHSLVAGLAGGVESSGFVFFCYFCFFVAFWILYFLTPALKVRSLRTLLMCTSSMRRMHVDVGENGDGYIADIREKSRTSITMLAILVATSMLVIRQALVLLDDGAISEWTRVCAVMALGSGFLAMVFLVVSVDTLDSVFNRFGARDSAESRAMADFFHIGSADSKYLGLALFFFAVIAFMAGRDPYLGALATGAVMAIGWHHWYPRISGEGIDRIVTLEQKRRDFKLCQENPKVDPNILAEARAAFEEAERDLVSAKISNGLRHGLTQHSALPIALRILGVSLPILLHWLQFGLA